jgi:hypothetical protein
MKKTPLVFWAIMCNIVLFCLLLGYGYITSKNHTASIRSFSEQIHSLQTENQQLRLSLATMQNIQKNAAPREVSHDNSVPPQATLAPVLQPNEPNAITPNEALASSNSLKVIQNALRQIHKSNGQNDANGLAQLQMENTLLKEEIARLQSLLNVQQTSGAVLTEIQTQQQQTQTIVTSVMNELNGNASPDQKIKLLESLSELAGSQDPALLAVIQRGLSDSYPDVRTAAANLLNNYHNPDAIPLISEALDNPDKNTRLAVLNSLEEITDPGISGIYLKAIGDQEEDIRSAAMTKLGSADQLPDDTLLAIYGSAIVSPHTDVKKETLSLLELRGDHKSIDIVIEGLKDADSEFVEDVNSTLSFLIDKEFSSYNEAKNWWSKNKDKYDENLMEK